jgi:putative oxidoreductase
VGATTMRPIGDRMENPVQGYRDAVKLSRRISRPMLSAAFVAGGAETLRNPGPRVKKSEAVALRIASTLGLPQDPELLVKLNAALQVTAGLALATGKFRRLAALTLVASTIPTTLGAHRFWEIDDPEERAEQRMHFFKNVGVMGGLILTLFDPADRPSATVRAARAAGHAAKLVPGLTQDAGLMGADVARRTGDKALKASAVAAAGARAGLSASEHALVLAKQRSLDAGTSTRRAARRAAGNIGRITSANSRRAGQLLSSGSDRVGEALSAGNQRASHLLNQGSERASELVAKGTRRAGHARHRFH